MSGNKTPRIFVSQPRELHLFEELANMRVVDVKQARLITPYLSTTRANTRLPLLVRNGLLKQFYLATEKGGKKSIFTLAPKGAALANGCRGLERPAKRLLLGDAFVAHQLSINEVYLAVKYRPVPAGVQFVRWTRFAHSLSPACPIIPDGYFELKLADKTVTSFLEVDMGTETAKSWKPKIDFYLRYALSTEFHERFHQPQFRVLVITTSTARINSIRSLVAPRTSKIFWFSTFDAINREGFWSPVWLRPTGDHWHSLL